MRHNVRDCYLYGKMYQGLWSLARRGIVDPRVWHLQRKTLCLRQGGLRGVVVTDKGHTVVDDA